MSTNATNALSRQKADIEIIVGSISKAQTSYAQSKDAAGIAAANAYMVWLYTMSPRAHKDNRNWMDTEIFKVNQAIDDYNKDEKLSLIHISEPTRPY